jgi:hypothetical protein
VIDAGINWGASIGQPTIPDAPALSRIRMYRDASVAIAPARLQSPVAKIFLEAIGAELDYTVERLSLGILFRWPQYASEDALNLIGQARLIERYPEEGLEDYRARVAGAQDFWALAGTNEGMLTALEQLGYTGYIHPWSAPRQSEFDITLTPGRRTYDNSPAELERIVRVIRRVKKADSELYRVFYTSQSTFSTWGQPGLTWGQNGLTWGVGRTEIYRRA